MVSLINFPIFACNSLFLFVKQTKLVMKKIYFLDDWYFLFCSIICPAGTSYIRNKPLGFSFFLSDFKTAANIRTNGLVSVLKDKSFFNPSTMNPGFALDYLSGISKHVDFIATLGGSFVDYPD